MKSREVGFVGILIRNSRLSTWGWFCHRCGACATVYTRRHEPSFLNSTGQSPICSSAPENPGSAVTTGRWKVWRARWETHRALSTWEGQSRSFSIFPRTLDFPLQTTSTTHIFQANSLCIRMFRLFARNLFVSVCVVPPLLI